MSEEALLRLIGTYGPMGLVSAVLGWLLWKYGPRMVEAHMSFMESCDKIQTEQAVALRTLAENDVNKAKQHSKTHRMLGRHADAIQAFADEMGHGEAVKPHVNEIRRLIEE